jgi:hypothetical protein
VRLLESIYWNDWFWHPTGALRGPTPLGAPVGAAAEHEYLYLNFRMNRDGRVRLLPSFHLHGLGSAAESAPRDPVACELRDASREVIRFHRCHRTDPHVDPDGPYRDYYEAVRWESETRYIAFLRGGEEVDEIEVEEQAPEMTVQPVTELDRTNNRMSLEWEGRHETEPLTYLVRYSNDGGENWLGVAASLIEPRFEVDLDTLPGGTAVFSRWLPRRPSVPRSPRRSPYPSR